MAIQEPNVPGQFSLPQLNFLYELVLSADPATCVEIGCYMGRSTYAICLALKHLPGDRKVICVDSWQQVVSQDYFVTDSVRALFRKFPEVADLYVSPEAASVMDLFNVTLERYPFMKDYVEVRRVDSRSVDLSQTAIDFAFIDANHTYAGVKNDIAKVLEGAGPGTVIAFHDYSEEHYPGVVRAVAELREWRSHEWLGQVGYTVALRLRE